MRSKSQLKIQNYFWNENGGTQINGQKTKKLKTMHKSLQSRDGIDRFFVSRNKEDVDLPELRIALIYQYKKSMITLKRTKKTFLQQAITIMKTKGK